jgi:hypothetical protein
MKLNRLYNYLFTSCLDNNELVLTSRQPSNAGGFRKWVFTKPASDKGKVNIKQVNPALRLPAERYVPLKPTNYETIPN